jgi:DNA-binding NarL/FixJ family response regulator
LEKDKNIGLVLIDIKMPKQNGIEITREIKRLHPNIKVIVVTGYAAPKSPKKPQLREQMII